MGRLSISMPDALSEYVESQVRDGRFERHDAFFQELVRSDRDKSPLTPEAFQVRMDQARASGVSHRQLPEIMAEVKAKLKADGLL